MLLSTKLGETVEIPIEVVPKNSFLYLLLTDTASVPTKKNQEGIIEVESTLDELELLRNYLINGRVDNITRLVELLDYYGIYTFKVQYDQQFAEIKLAEDWYRNNLYNPRFADTLGKDDTYDLISLTSDILLTHFDLVNNIHFMYTKSVYQEQNTSDCTVRNFIIKDQLVPREPYTNDNYHSARLLHSYSKSFVSGEKGRLFDSVKLCNDMFMDRDREFNNEILREVVLAKRPNRTYQDFYSDIPLNRTRSLETIKDKLNHYHICETLLKSRLWNNVLLAGGSVLNAVIDYNAVKDYDLFIYGLSEDQATEKVHQIAAALSPDEICRTEHAITFRKRGDSYGNKGYYIQIILRLYQTKSEVLHGFDLDSSCVGYDGTTIWLTSRSLYSLKYMINTIDFDRMSPTYEVRLAKYMVRGFAIHIPDFNQKQINKSKIQDFIDSAKKSKYPTGLDFLLLHYYSPITSGYLNRKSDYDKHGLSKYETKVESSNGLVCVRHLEIPPHQLRLLTGKNNHIIGYAIKINHSYSVPSIPSYSRFPPIMPQVPRLASPRAYIPRIESPPRSPVASPRASPVASPRAYIPRIDTPLSSSPIESPPRSPVASPRAYIPRIDTPPSSPRIESPPSSPRIDSPRRGFSYPNIIPSIPLLASPVAPLPAFPTVPRLASPRAYIPRIESPPSSPRIESPRAPLFASPVASPRAYIPRIESPPSSPRIESPRRGFSYPNIVPSIPLLASPVGSPRGLSDQNIASLTPLAEFLPTPRQGYQSRSSYQKKLQKFEKNTIDLNLTKYPDILDHYPGLKPFATIRWKITNPGEQSTSTFHRLVLEDVSKWYTGEFYN